MSKIHIPTPLRQYVGKQPTVEVTGATVAEAMDSLVAQHPDVRRHLYTEEGKLRAFVNLYVNDEDIRYLQKEQTEVKEGDNISIVPSIAGGTENTTSTVIPSKATQLPLSSRAKPGILVFACSSSLQAAQAGTKFPASMEMTNFSRPSCR
jgi:molybdopterin synthase sulfur carrier subunit